MRNWLHCAAVIGQAAEGSCSVHGHGWCGGVRLLGRDSLFSVTVCLLFP